MSGRLASWRDGPSRRAILDFLELVCREGSPGHVTPAERIAVFDNDGTLWCERPAPVQAYFICERARALVAADPERAGADEVLRSLAIGDLAAALAVGPARLIETLTATHAGVTVDAFAAEAAAWLRDATHPQRGVPFRELVYQPMLELLDLLGTHGFRSFIVTGGGVEFVRAISDELYGVAPADVIGTAVELELVRDDTGLQLVRQPRLSGSPNEGAPKPIRIQEHIGQRPILAAGNSAGDREMLEYAASGQHPALCLLVDHDDAEREYAYASTSLTDPTAEPITTTAARHGWTMVSMQREWTTIFPQAAR